jgi:hypothetical protein
MDMAEAAGDQEASLQETNGGIPRIAIAICKVS